jgi:hypothetical protein
MQHDTTQGTTRVERINYAAMVEELSVKSAQYRQRLLADDPTNFEIITRRDSDYLSMYGIGVTGPRQTGKTFLAYDMMLEDSDTLMVVVNSLFATAAIDNIVHLSADSLDLDRLKWRIATGRDVLRVNAFAQSNPLDPDNPLHTVKRVVVDEAYYIQDKCGATLRDIAHWARLGGQSPEIVIIN